MVKATGCNKAKSAEHPKNESSDLPGLSSWAQGHLPRARVRVRMGRTPQRARGPPVDYADKPTRD